MSRSSYLRKIFPGAPGTIAMVSALALFWSAVFAAAADQKVVGSTLLSLAYPFLTTLGEAMKMEAKQKGIELLSLDPRQNVATELSQVKDLIKQQVDLIVMIPVDQNSSQTAARLINEAGIPLVLLNTKFTDTFASNGGKFVTYIGSDDLEAGKIEGRYLAETLPAGGNVIYLVGQYGGASTERRKTGFESVLKDHPNLRIVTELQGYGSRERAKTVIERILQKFSKGELQALVAQNDEMAIGASTAIQAAGRLSEFKVLIGVDGSQPALDAVGNGTLTATVFQDAIGQGTEAIVTAGKILADQSVAPELLIPFKLVTKENVSSFAPQANLKR
jgi:ABC-type sugar transport system substrate-binding protein